ncbi:MAG: hypothetical protein ACTSWG_04840, partial [Candidatus Helarchaeota archaeon]
LNNSKKQKEIFNHTNCVLFFDDITCSFKSNEKQCEKMKESFLLKEFLFYKEKNKIYTFYKIN